MGEAWVVEWGKCVSLACNLILILTIGAVAILGRAETLFVGSGRNFLQGSPTFLEHLSCSF